MKNSFFLMFIALLACDIRPVIPGGPSHDITITTDAGTAQFYNRRTESVFVPRGNNLVGDMPHQLLNVGVFDVAAIEGRLKKMNEVGYNTIRIWLNDRPGGVGDYDDGEGLNAAYIDNISTLLNLADRYDIQVIFTIDWLPGVEPYLSLSNSAGENFWGHHVTYLSPEGQEADRKFWNDFAAVMTGLPMARRIMAYELRNEFYFDDEKPPFDHDPSGNYFRVVTTADGLTYDLSVPGQADAMMNNNMIHYFKTMKDAIHDVDPNGLLTCGLIITRIPNMGRGDLAIDYGDLDFYDVHIYPHEFYNAVTDYMVQYGINGHEEFPILVGEFGARREASDVTRGTFPGYNALYGSEADWYAAQEMIDWQTQMCQYDIDGWLTWDYDSQHAFFDAIADRDLGDRIGEPVVIPAGTEPGPGPWYGYLGYLMSPLVRPDACSPESKIVVKH